MKGFTAALAAAAAMIATPVAAAPNAAVPGAAASLSVAKTARVTAHTARGEKLGGSGNGRFLIAAAVTAAIVAGIFIVADRVGDDDDSDSN